MHKTNDFKLQFLGIIPQLKDKTGLLTPEQVKTIPGQAWKKNWKKGKWKIMIDFCCGF